MARSSHTIVLAAGILLALTGPTYADPVKCQKSIVQQMLKLKKAHLKAHTKCLDAENGSKIPGPCPDAAANLKIQKVSLKATSVISVACSMADLAALGFPSDCAFEAGVSGVEAQCAGLPVTTPGEFADCLKCWKRAELSEFVALALAQPDRVGRDLDQLVLEPHRAVRDEADGLVVARGAHVGELLLSGDVDVQVDVTRVLSNDHPLVDGRPCLLSARAAMTRGSKRTL